MAVAGAAITWLRDNMSLLPNFAQVTNLAATDEDLQKGDSDVYFVPAFSGLYAPYWQQDARG